MSDVVSYTDHFVIDGVQVHPDMATALARQIKPDLSGTVSYSKEKSWDAGGFATAPVRKEGMANAVSCRCPVDLSGRSRCRIEHRVVRPV